MAILPHPVMKSPEYPGLVTGSPVASTGNSAQQKAMSNESKNLWRREFGGDYQIPAVFDDENLFEDMSWHNDACPRFKLTALDRGIAIFVEHHDPEKREDDGPRYHVSTYADEDMLEWIENIYQGDDFDEAMRACGIGLWKTDDGYVFTLQQDGSLTDGDMTFGSVSELRESNNAQPVAVRS